MSSTACDTKEILAVDALDQPPRGREKLRLLVGTRTFRTDASLGGWCVVLRGVYRLFPLEEGRGPLGWGDELSLGLLAKPANRHWCPFSECS